MKYSGGGLIKLLMLLSIVGFITLTLVLTVVFSDAFYKNLDSFSSDLEVSYNKSAKIEAEDKIKKITDFIKIYRNMLQENAKQRVRDNVNFAINIIDNIYKQYKNFPKEFIYQKINDRLRNLRFFSDKSGYFFIYDMQGYCILLPTTPSLEGSNQINFLDGKKEHTIQKAIRLVKSKGEGYATWYWYKIGKKRMQKKIGFIKLFKPLNIFVGSARYQEDIDKTVKEELKRYLNGLDKDDYGYIFAYDFSGNSMMDTNSYRKINVWNHVSNRNHLVRLAIRGARIHPEGYFVQYSLKDGEDRFSYIKLIPELNWIIGTNVKSANSVYQKQKENLEINLKETLEGSIYIVLSVLLVLISGFLLISFKIGQIYESLEKAVADKTAELTEKKNIFKKLFDRAVDGIALSRDKRIYDCNEALLKIFEAEEKSLMIESKIEDLFPLKQEDGKDSMEYLQNRLDMAKKFGSANFDIEAKTFKGRKIWLNVVAIKVIIENEEAGYLIIRDITDKIRIERDLKEQQDRLIFQAKHDPLTSLPNRMFLMDRLFQSINRAKRNKRCFAVAFLDIDNFKIINDAFGHDMGDLLLIEIASVLRSIVRVTDTVSRISGDEFILLIDDLNSADDSSNVLQKIVDKFQEPFYIKNHPFSITFSIGVSMFPNDAKDEQSLLKYADMAMYRAKNSGKNRYVYYDVSMNSDILEHIKIEQEIRKGIENEEFILHYQPQFEINTGEIVGFEALVRWQHPKFGLKYPDYFIQIAENSNLIVPLGELISQKAMKQIAVWYKEGLNPGVMSINFTSKQLEVNNFFDKLERLLEKTECKTEWIEAELIERYVMRDTKKTTSLLKSFKDLGIQVAIDDFGTGYSSLSYLKYLEISKLKIDKAFIDELENDKKDQAIAKSIIDLSIGLDLKVLAEGVETKKQYEILKELGCQFIQGYYFSKPIGADEAHNLLREKAEEK